MANKKDKLDDFLDAPSDAVDHFLDSPADATEDRVNPKTGLHFQAPAHLTASQGAEIATLPITLPGQALGAVADKIAETGGELGYPKLGVAAAAVPGLASAALPTDPAQAGVALLGMGLPAGTGDKALKIGGAAAEKFTPTFKKALEAAGNLKVTPTIAEITGSKAWGGLEALLEKLPFSSSKIQAIKAANIQRLLEARANLMEKFGPSKGTDVLGAETKETIGGALDAVQAARDAGLKTARGKALASGGPAATASEAGGLAKDAAAAASEAARKEATQLYAGVSKEIPEHRNLWPADNLRAAARRILKQKGSSPSTLDSETAATLREISDSPQGLTWEKLHDLQSSYGQVAKANNYAAKVGAAGTAGFGTIKGAIFNDLKNAAREDMGEFAKAVGPGAQKKYEFATAFYKQYKDTYANDTIRKMLRTEPQYVYDEIVKPGSIQDIQRLKSAVGESGFSNMRRQFLEDVLGGPDSPVPSVAKITEKLGAYDKEALSEILTPQQFKQVNGFVKTSQLPQFMQTEIEQRLGKIVKRDPLQVVPAILSGDTEIVKATRKIVGDKGMLPFKRKLLEEALGNVEQDITGPAKLQRVLDSYSPEFLKEMFTEKELGEIKAIASVRGLLKTPNVLAGNPSGTASGAAAAGQALLGAGVSGWHLTNPANLLAIYLTPPMVAKMYTSDIGRKLILEGLSVSPQSVRAATLAAKIAAYAGVKLGKNVGNPLPKEAGSQSPVPLLPGKY